MRRNLTLVIIAVILAMVTTIPAYAAWDGANKKQGDPQVDLSLRVVHHDGSPVMLPQPDGTMVEARPNNVPPGRDVYVKAKAMPSTGDRDGKFVAFRVNGIRRPIVDVPNASKTFKLNPYTQEPMDPPVTELAIMIPTWNLPYGDHSVEAMVSTTNKIGGWRTEKFVISNTTYEAYEASAGRFFRPAKERVTTETRQLPGPPTGIEPPPQSNGSRQLRWNSNPKTIYCPYAGGDEVEVGTELSVRLAGRETGQIRVTKLGPQGFWAKVTRGSAPQGAEIDYPDTVENGGH